MDNRHGLLAIFDNDLRTSAHVCQDYQTLLSVYGSPVFGDVQLESGALD
jgi:hypothetical protein